MSSEPVRRLCLALALAAAIAALPARPASAPGASEDFEAIAAAQAVANAKPGPRTTPGMVIPVPTADVSPEMQAIIAAPYGPFRDAPGTAAEWKRKIAERTRPVLDGLPALRQALGVTIQPAVIGGVKAFILEPRAIPPKNRNRLLVLIHGGAYVFYPGEAGTGEGTLMAGLGGFKVICIDYRMPPNDPYPAALDDTIAVWRELLKSTKPENVGMFGTSSGGGLLLATMLRAKDERLPLPGAIAPGTPWSDLDKIGDSYFANAWIDNYLVNYDRELASAARLYASGQDLRNPYLSPVYGDFSGFPPTILTTGTRDLFLSNTVRVHRKLRRAGVIAELNVYEGVSHAEYLALPDVPETREAFGEIAEFFDRHLAE
ncbi:MAG TPA: alpha/beta hydrolase [Roseiarcus sp.]